MCERKLSATFIPARADYPGERFGALAAWCPWCEEIHFHGSAGKGDTARTEQRGAHCCHSSASPYLETGYALDVKGRMQDAGHLLPSAPVTRPARDGKASDQRRPKLWQRLDATSPALIKRLLGGILGKTLRSLNFEQVRLPDGSRLNIQAGGESWDIDREGTPIQQGKGVIALAAALYGLPEEVAFIRIIEAATGLTFDAEALHGLQLTYCEWIAAGRPERQHL